MALGNQFLVENWFFNGGIKIEPGSFNNMDENSEYNDSNILQSGGGNPYQPTDGLLIPGKNKPIIENKKILLWTAEGDLINNMRKVMLDDEVINNIKTYRENLITEQDIKNIKNDNINSIRISVGWWIFAEKPEEYGIITDHFYNGKHGKHLVNQVKGGLKWIKEYLCKWAHENDMYIILDIHSAPGGSSWGVSYAGIPSVWDKHGHYGQKKQYNWLLPVFYVEKLWRGKNQFLYSLISI